MTLANAAKKLKKTWYLCQKWFKMLLDRSNGDSKQNFEVNDSKRSKVKWEIATCFKRVRTWLCYNELFVSSIQLSWQSFYKTPSATCVCDDRLRPISMRLSQSICTGSCPFFFLFAVGLSSGMAIQSKLHIVLLLWNVYEILQLTNILSPNPSPAQALN